MSITSDFDVPVSHKPIEVESKLPEVVLVVSLAMWGEKIRRRGGEKHSSGETVYNMLTMMYLIHSDAYKCKVQPIGSK